MFHPSVYIPHNPPVGRLLVSMPFELPAGTWPNVVPRKAALLVPVENGQRRFCFNAARLTTKTNTRINTPTAQSSFFDQPDGARWTNGAVLASVFGVIGFCVGAVAGFTASNDSAQAGQVVALSGTGSLQKGHFLIYANFRRGASATRLNYFSTG